MRNFYNHGNCIRCGNEILRLFTRETARGLAKFCNRTCNLKWMAEHKPHNFQNKLETINCLNCGIQVQFYEAQYPGRKYCTAKCRYIHLASTKPKKIYMSITTRRSQSFRVAIRKLLIDKCVICDWTETKNDICHIKAVKDGGPNTLDNIVMMCPNHHRLFDSGKLALEIVLANRPKCIPTDLNFIDASK